MCFAVAAALLRERVRGPVGLLGLFALFPCTFFMANVGAGAATIVAIHLQDTSRVVVTLATLVSIGCAVWLVKAAGMFMPVAATAPAPRPSPASVDRAVGVGA
jgi:hypothetical protein